MTPREHWAQYARRARARNLRMARVYGWEPSMRRYYLANARHYRLMERRMTP